VIKRIQNKLEVKYVSDYHIDYLLLLYSHLHRLGKTVVLDYTVPYPAIWALVRVCLRNVDKQSTPLSARRRRLYFHPRFECRPLRTINIVTIRFLL